jgi:hypothetical protein
MTGPLADPKARAEQLLALLKAAFPDRFGPEAEADLRTRLQADAERAAQLRGQPLDFTDEPDAVFRALPDEP